MDNGDLEVMVHRNPDMGDGFGKIYRREKGYRGRREDRGRKEGRREYEFLLIFT